MKRILYYIVVMFAFILLLPFAILGTILWIYLKLALILIGELSKYVRNAAKMPKWFECFLSYVMYITGLKNED